MKANEALTAAMNTAMDEKAIVLLSRAYTESPEVAARTLEEALSFATTLGTIDSLIAQATVLAEESQSELAKRVVEKAQLRRERGLSRVRPQSSAPE